MARILRKPVSKADCVVTLPKKDNSSRLTENKKYQKIRPVRRATILRDTREVK